VSGELFLGLLPMLPVHLLLLLLLLFLMLLLYALLHATVGGICRINRLKKKPLWLRNSYLGDSSLWQGGMGHQKH